MATKRLKQILEEYLKGTDFDEINNTISIQKAWKETVGNPISKNTNIQSFKNGIINIKVSNPVWRNELYLQKHELIIKLKKTCADLKVKEIIFK